MNEAKIPSDVSSGVDRRAEVQVRMHTPEPLVHEAGTWR